MKNIQDTLAERGNNYGNFYEGATIVQNLKTIVHFSEKWPELDPDMKEAIEMIFHKIARIINGNHSYEDSWRDCAGYATLVADRLYKQQLVKEKCYLQEFKTASRSMNDLKGDDLRDAMHTEFTARLEEANKAGLIK